ncbi:MAG TPA: hypothetical protein VMV46_07525 [Thermoanaerobaculia bacterium]|nr:hypothetical protein [Thermoanaerobaculia bacterium]
MAERTRDDGASGWRSWRSLPWLSTWPRRVAVALLALELVYLIAANVFLHTEAGMAVINRKPDKVRVAFDGAWTVLPGLVRLRGLELAGDSRRVSWSTKIDRAWTMIWIPSLVFKHVRIVGGRQSGAEVAIEVRPEPDEPRRPKPGRGWKVTLGGLRVEDLRRFAVNQYEIVPEGLVRGWVQFQARGPMELRIDRVRFDDATVRSSGEEVATGLQLDAGFTTEPWRVGLQTVDELLAGASGEVALDAQVANLGFLHAYLRKVPWLLLGGSGGLSLALDVERGSVLPGSALALSGEEIWADFFDFRARGSGRVAGTVESREKGIELGAILDRFSIDRSSDGASMLVGEGLESLVMIASTALDEPPEDVAGAVKLTSARAEDLSQFGPYFPGGLELDLVRGAAELSMDLVFDTGARSGHGELEVELRDVAASYGDAGVAASGSIDVVLPALDLKAGRYDISGTRVDLENGRIAHRGKVRSDAWWVHLAIPSGTLELPRWRAGSGSAALREVALSADLEVAMSDTAPIVVLMEQRLPRLRFIDGLLTISEVELTGRVEARGRTLGLRGIEVSGGEKDQLTILLDLDLDGPRTAGVAYARYRALDAAVALDGDGRDWGILHPKRMYEEALAEYRRQRGVPP